MTKSRWLKKGWLDYHQKPKRIQLPRVYYLTGRAKWKRRLSIGLIILVITGGSYFLLYSDYFKIQKIILKGEEKITTQEIESLVNQISNQKRFLIFSQKNIFLFNKNQFKRIISEKYNLQELKILKKLPSKLEIEIKERLPFLVLAQEENLWLLGDKGQILEKIPGEKIIKNSLPLVSVSTTPNNLTNLALSPGQKIFSKERVYFITEIFRKLPSKVENLKIISFKIPDLKESKIIVKTQEEWEIYLDENFTAEEQLNNLYLILREKIKKEERKNLKYIDLRFGEKIYYK